MGLLVLLRPDGGFSIEGNLDAAVVRYTEEITEWRGWSGS